MQNKGHLSRHDVKTIRPIYHLSVRSRGCWYDRLSKCSVKVYHLVVMPKILSSSVSNIKQIAVLLDRNRHQAKQEVSRYPDRHQANHRSRCLNRYHDRSKQEVDRLLDPSRCLNYYPDHRLNRPLDLSRTE
jgi:hypothetical protein